MSAFFGSFWFFGRGLHLDERVVSREGGSVCLFDHQRSVVEIERWKVFAYFSGCLREIERYERK